MHSMEHPGRHGGLSSMPSLLSSASPRQVNILASPSPSSPPSTARLSIRVAAPDATDNERRFHISFVADSELYDWQDDIDIYSRAAPRRSAAPARHHLVLYIRPTSTQTSREISVTPYVAEIIGGGSQSTAAASAPPEASIMIVQAPAVAADPAQRQ